ncbi:MoxR-like ATPase [Thermomonospora echinospora]|uniref:MoxR-like ATPase n=1 Tax=Thermomonospora echinospora TaxID=1992 RepID=A0A1H6CJV2_9ACTN|nr:MoxR family ATPase [Thermomonospora echinospora]SEG73198.1 MoxR-like ATPase [Thermomonospora echinospora]
MTTDTYLHAPGKPLTANEAAIAADEADRLATAIESVVLGKPGVVRLALTALFSEGHLLLEDVPGVGKTTLARGIAAVMEGDWRRVQFTPDLLPADVTGVTVFNQRSREFEFHPGPVFANVLIADEINRASPKTQSALLEVMEERHVTVDGHRHPVPRPFLVVATQNPVEMDGTYRLPEAQLDRFLMRLSLGYPDAAAELALMRGAALRSPEDVEPLTNARGVALMGELAARVFVHDQVYEYVLKLARQTREHPDLRLGVSPRGTVALVRAARTHALADGRPFVSPEDVKELVGPVWAHRLVLTPDAALRDLTGAAVLHQIVEATPAPRPGLAPAAAERA